MRLSESFCVAAFPAVQHTRNIHVCTTFVCHVLTRRGYALTMVDSLDMHAVVGDGESFRAAVGRLLNDFESGVLSFDRDVMVSVFEASIRVLGGLVRNRTFIALPALLIMARSTLVELSSRYFTPSWVCMTQCSWSSDEPFIYLVSAVDLTLFLIFLSFSASWILSIRH